MKKSSLFILLTLLAFVCLSIFTIPSARAWQTTISDCPACGSRVEAAVVDAAGDIIATGSFFYGADIVKLSGATGEVIWRSEVMGHESRNYVQDIAIDSHGDVFVVFAWTRLVIKVSGADGTKIWDKPIGGTLNALLPLINAVVVDRDDNVITAGTMGGYFNVSKLDGRTGDEKWHYDARGGYAMGVAVARTGEVAAAGMMNNNFATVKLSADGHEIWYEEINGEGNFTDVFEEARAVRIGDDGSVVVAGVTVGVTGEFRDCTKDFTVAKYFPDGTKWIRTINGSLLGRDDRGNIHNGANDEANAVTIDNNEDVISAGSYQVSPEVDVNAPEHFHVFKLSGSNGQTLWGGAADEIPRNQIHPFGRAFAISVDAANDVAAAGVHAGRFTVVKFLAAASVSGAGQRPWPRPFTINTSAVGGSNAVSVLMDADKNVVAAGETIGSDGWSKFTVVKIQGTDGTDYFADAPTPSPTPVVTPVIFIPGIAGSYLKELDGNQNELWPGGLFTNHKELSLNPNSPDFRPQVNPEDVMREIAIPVLRDFQVYKPLLDALHRAGYVEGGATPTLFVFPYDWRKSNIVNATLLRNKIIEIRERYSNSKVNIVTHSMGGLIARRYILNNPDPDLHHVDKLITLAAPWLGAPKVLLTLETGEFLNSPMKEIVGRSTLKDLVKFFPSAHELIPSRAYFNLGGRPFAEQGWDINGDGEGRGLGGTQIYEDYDQLYSLLNYRFAESIPAITGAEFHDRVGQDDWRNAGFGVRTYHIHGIKPRADTIRQVVAKLKLRCRGLPRTRLPLCFFYHEFDTRQGRGDGTVPTLSATRIAAAQDYNSENSIIVPPFIGDDAEHLKLSQNPDVHLQILSLLNAAPSSLAERMATTMQSIMSEPVTEQAYYLRVEGAATATLTDQAGNATHPLSDAPEAGVPEVTSYRLGADSFLSITPTNRSYVLTFVTGEGPIVIDLTKGTDVETVHATRYLDLDLPRNTTVRLDMTPEAVGTLRYDSDGDGTFETTVTPTVSVSGPGAQDTESPIVTFQEGVQPTSRGVTINATDDSVGVSSVWYSLDGTSFQLYVGPLTLNPRQTAVIYAFAVDNLANRSALAVYTLKQSPQSISGLVKDANGNRMSGVTITVTGSQTATTATDTSGSYFFGSLAAAGYYTVVPSKSNFVFSPRSQTFTNLSGNQTADFWVLDTTAPQLQLPSNLLINANIPQGAIVFYTVTATDNDSQSPRVACIPPPGTIFPIGTNIVACTATDDAGNSATGTFKVIVKGPADQISDLITLVKGFDLHSGTENGLVVKLQHALAKAKAGGKAVACTQLGAFINEVQAQTGKKISGAQSIQMLNAANQIRAVLGC